MKSEGVTSEGIAMAVLSIVIGCVAGMLISAIVIGWLI
jgi:hypothetical protein